MKKIIRPSRPALVTPLSGLRDNICPHYEYYSKSWREATKLSNIDLNLLASADCCSGVSPSGLDCIKCYQRANDWGTEMFLTDINGTGTPNDYQNLATGAFLKETTDHSSHPSCNPTYLTCLSFLVAYNIGFQSLLDTVGMAFYRRSYGDNYTDVWGNPNSGEPGYQNLYTGDTTIFNVAVTRDHSSGEVTISNVPGSGDIVSTVDFGYAYADFRERDIDDPPVDWEPHDIHKFVSFGRATDIYPYYGSPTSLSLQVMAATVNNKYQFFYSRANVDILLTADGS